jgi:hypothetical protein
VITSNNNNNNKNTNSSGTLKIQTGRSCFFCFFPPFFHDGWNSAVWLAGQNNDNVLIY